MHISQEWTGGESTCHPLHTPGAQQAWDMLSNMQCHHTDCCHKQLRVCKGCAHICFHMLVAWIWNVSHTLTHLNTWSLASGEFQKAVTFRCGPSLEDENHCEETLKTVYSNLEAISSPLSVPPRCYYWIYSYTLCPNKAGSTYHPWETN